MFIRLPVPGMLLVIRLLPVYIITGESGSGTEGAVPGSDMLKIFLNKMVFDGEPLIGMSPSENVSATLTFDPMTLKNFAHMMNIYAKFH